MNSSRSSSIAARAQEIQERICEAHEVTVAGKPLVSKLVERAVDGRWKLWGLPIGPDRTIKSKEG